MKTHSIFDFILISYQMARLFLFQISGKIFYEMKDGFK